VAFKIIWGEKALQDLEDLTAYIAARNPAAAEAIGLAILAQTRRLADFPESGVRLRERRHPAYREAVVAPFRIIHHVSRKAQTVRIVRIWHGARGTPEF
jgi:plasmid stabilization system protein ParE